jgi:molybdenum cofactor cytidylyltransferase
LGAFAEQIQPLLAFANVEITKNENWQKGMSLELTQNNDAVLVLLSDQSFVNTTLVNLIIEKATETDLSIITTKYNNIVGVPLLFKQAIFQY